jgi:hypothetical protein
MCSEAPKRKFDPEGNEYNEANPKKKVGDDEDSYSPEPIHIQGAFDPNALCGTHPSGWAAMLMALSPALPVQMHLEPTKLDDENAPPFFKKTITVLRSRPEFADLVDVAKARLKFRVSGKGKFIHRNRYRRRNIIMCLMGEMRWLFVESQVKDDEGKSLADGTLDANTNDNWNGYRSNRYPSGLSWDEMKMVASQQNPNVRTKIVTMHPGDAMTFDGRWWHATQYDDPVMSLFFTPGKDMEVAVAEHKRRMAMPMQADLKIATINRAKCSKLSTNYQLSSAGELLDWQKLEQDAKDFAQKSNGATVAQPEASA